MQEFIPQAIEFAQKHTFLTIAWFAVLFMTLFTFFKSATQKYRVITNPEAVRLMNDEEAVVIDLRPIDEFQRGHIIGSVNITKKNRLSLWMLTVFLLLRPQNF